MTTLNDICDTLAEQIRDWLPADVNVYSEEIDSPEPPYVMILEGLSPLVTYHATFEPEQTVALQVKVGARAARTPDVRRQIRDLLSYGTDFSVVNAIEVKPGGALGGLVDDITCTSAEIVDDGTEIFGLINVDIQA